MFKAFKLEEFFEKVEKQMLEKYAYLCNMHKCEKCSYPKCSHTTDERYRYGNWENVNAEVALRLVEKIKKHPILWKHFFMVA